MKKFSFLLLFISFSLFAQQSSKINNAQNVWTSVANPVTLVGCEAAPSGIWKPYLKDDLRWETYNINGLNTQIQDVTSILYEPIFSKNNAFNLNFGTASTTIAEGNDIRIINGQTAFGWGNHTGLYPLLAGSYTNPSWLVSLPYSKITGTPTIPTDNNQLTNGSNYITSSSTNTLINKSGDISQWTNNSGYISSVPAQSFSSLTEKPTTLLGYGITDAYPITGNPSNFLTTITSGQVTGALGYTPITNARTLNINGTAFDLSANRTWTVGDVTTANLTAGLATKENTITAGTNLQYWRGDKTWQTLNTTAVPEGANLYYTDSRARASVSLTTTGSGAASYNSSNGVLNIPTQKRIETFQITTGGAGTASATYTTAFTNPNVQFNFIGGDPRDTIRLTTNTTTGCTVTVQRRVDVIGLLPTYNAVSGAVVNILATEN